LLGAVAATFPGAAAEVLFAAGAATGAVLSGCWALL
jgi:hypothetical protein